jgi:hypothetical protein
MSIDAKLSLVSVHCRQDQVGTSTWRLLRRQQVTPDKNLAVCGICKISRKESGEKLNILVGLDGNPGLLGFVRLNCI